MVAHTYNLSTWGGVPGQPSLKKIQKIMSIFSLYLFREKYFLFRNNNLFSMQYSAA